MQSKCLKALYFLQKHEPFNIVNFIKTPYGLMAGKVFSNARLVTMGIWPEVYMCRCCPHMQHLSFLLLRSTFSYLAHTRTGKRDSEWSSRRKTMSLVEQSRPDTDLPMWKHYVAAFGIFAIVVLPRLKLDPEELKEARESLTGRGSADTQAIRQRS